MIASKDKIAPYKVGQWLPSDQAFLETWVQTHIEEVEANPKELLPIIEEFKNLIENDPELFMYFNLMFDQVPQKPPYNKTPTNKPQVRDYMHMLKLLNGVMTKAPEFNKTGLVGFPINAILDWPMATEAGYTAFLNTKVNKQLKKILNEWAKYLGSKDSTYVLSDDPKHGWFGTDAKNAIPHFATEFKCDPSAVHYGFKSWDDFFIRQFKEDQRPVAEPNNDSIVVNACESSPFRIAKDIKLRDSFWIKSQPYSLQHILNGDSNTEKFVGGTIYQAFLSALSYHRWHSPVNGKIVKAYTIDGTYYSEPLSEGFENTDGPDPSAPNNSQGYLTEVASRALIFIEADNPEIGLMCFVAVGMAEVSSNEITVYEGQHIKKGEQLGMFHFGGSTYCLLFRPEVNLKFDLHGQNPGLNSSTILINSKIAEIVK
ncbi:phosphatidylserine decarboxylase family protein [Cellulophaga sp. Z1A5H]|uniref:phosphatidylserine decarboxylase family protein n=1 Tax=Cellulophaga sp. Z1A5H TaxID=2687291 RepID=UPI0013FD9AF6|nr:phosphatidylserine decarboxylase family protein [Cellulophaga sp. Z1A5H]